MQKKWLCGIFLVCFLTLTSFADFSENLITIEAYNNNGLHGSYAISLLNSFYDSTDQFYSMNQTTLLDLKDIETNEHIAYIRKIGCFARMYQPKITLDFIAEAGNSDVIFIITSTRISFPLILENQSYISAYATFTAQDLNFNGAQLVSILAPGHGAFLAFINGTPFDNAIVVTELLNQVQVSAGGTVTGWQYDPPYGTRALHSNVFNMTGVMAFSITAHDKATCNARFELAGIPHPHGDMNCDGRINNFDINPFVLAILDPLNYSVQYPDCIIENADCNFDGNVNNFDINSFLDLLGI